MINTYLMFGLVNLVMGCFVLSVCCQSRFLLLTVCVVGFADTRIFLVHYKLIC